MTEKFCKKCDAVTARHINGHCIICDCKKHISMRKHRSDIEIKARKLERRKAYHRANLEVKARYREHNRRHQGLPEPTRRGTGHCECCGKTPSYILNLDHCHATGKFRGWLCTGCNTAIGKLGDNIAGLQRAMDYLNLGFTA
jgi:hypothetical protein